MATMQPKQFLRMLSIIHAALCFGLISFALFAYWQNGGFNIRMEKDDLFVYIVPIVAMSAYFAGKYLYQNLIGKLRKEEKLQIKLAGYQSALIIKYALIEGSALLALFAYLQKGTALYGVIAIALIIYLCAQGPTWDKLQTDIPLSFEDKKQFDTLSS